MTIEDKPLSIFHLGVWKAVPVLGSLKKECCCDGKVLTWVFVMETRFQIKAATLEVPSRQDLFGIHRLKIHGIFGEMVLKQCQMPPPRLEPLSLGGTLSLKPK